MRDPTPRPSAFGSLLHAASRLYALAVSVRHRWYASGRLPRRSLPVFVVSVGNLTVGGTGKTPMTVHLAQTARDLGFRTAVVSRGYGGRLQHTVAVAGDGRRPLLSADDVGDEPFMMANSLEGIPVVVGADRHAAGTAAIRAFGAEVLVLDDAFQHLALQRDLDIVMLDARRPLGNGCLLPRGPLRESAAGLRRAGAVVFTSGDSPVEDGPPEAGVPVGIPRFRGVRQPVVYERIGPEAAGVRPGSRPDGLAPRPESWLKGRRVAAFSGIADNDRFRDGLRALGCDVVAFHGFPDHHPYGGMELRRIADAASDRSAELVVTTEKDYARIAHRLAWPTPTAAVGVRMRLSEEDRFRRFLHGRIVRNVPPTAGRGGDKGG